MLGRKSRFFIPYNLICTYAADERDESEFRLLVTRKTTTTSGVGSYQGGEWHKFMIG